MPDDAARRDDALFVVGIGSSAGGLEALQALLPHLPARSHVSYIVAQHMAPQYRSMLVVLLARETSLQVVEASDGALLAPNTIYITPPGKNVVLEGEKLCLLHAEPRVVPKPSIDRLFVSLASQKKDKAAGIILSGTGSDGAYGLRAIKAEGGVTIAQTENSAKYSGMPNAAIETGLVDFILPPTEIGDRLLEILARQPVLLPPSEPEERTLLQTILALVKHHTGFDFSGYKKATLQRRLRRRMAMKRFNTLEAYTEHLRQTPEEARLLFKDVLISVTSFFREQEAFDVLSDALEDLLSREQATPLRIWVPGCATGEEPYSIAILLAELMGPAFSRHSVQIFATDVDEDALQIARRGLYAGTLLADLDPSIVRKYFEEEGEDTYLVRVKVREVVIFSRHDLTRDPPFSRLALVSCRNVLIYFESQLQLKVLSIFHYVLRKDGLLFLGKSESVNGTNLPFSVLDPKWKLFQKQRSGALRLPPLWDANTGFSPAERAPVQRSEKIRSRDFINRAMTAIFDAPLVLLDKDLRIIHVQGDVSSYLRMWSGDTSLELMSLLEPALQMPVRVLLGKAQKEKRHVSQPFTFRESQLRLHMVPANDRQLWLLVFEREKAVVEVEEQGVDFERHREEKEVLASELAATREHLHSTVEELETANEELQALNEELQSANEELLAMNEELETANEELQSTNEELSTINQELQVQTEEVNKVNSDLSSVMRQLDLGVILVDKSMRVRRFNAPAMSFFELSQETIGQSLSAVPYLLEEYNLFPDLRKVLQTQLPHETHCTHHGRALELKITPYAPYKAHPDGALLMFYDITEIREAEQELKEQNQLLLSVQEKLQKAHQVQEENIQSLKESNAALAMEIKEREEAEELVSFQANLLDVIGQAVIVTGLDGKISYWNRYAEKLYGWSSYEVIGKSIMEVTPSSQSQEEAHEIMALLYEGRSWSGDFQAKHRNGTEFLAHVVNTPILEDGKLTAIVGVSMDISDRHAAEESLREREQALTDTLARLHLAQEQLLKQERLAAVGQLSAGIAHDFNNILMALGFQVELLMEEVPEAAENGTLQTMESLMSTASNLTRQILDFSGKSRYEPVDTDLVTLLKSSQSFLRSSLPEDIELSFETSLRRCHVHVDHNSLQRALLNLALNARDAMPEGGHLTLKLSREHVAEVPPGLEGASAGHWICFCVEDTGAGIPPEAIPRVFEPFFSTKAGRGSGLGLSQVYGIMRRHGGWIDVSSSSQGTCFRLYFPELQASLPQPKAKSRQKMRGRGEYLLFVEDNAEIRKVVKAGLSQLNYHVLTASNGEEAIERYEQHDGPPIRLVLSDMVMPKMDGATLIQTLTQRDPGLRSVIISGYPLGRDGTEPLLDDIPWLQKPLSIVQLSQVIHALLHPEEHTGDKRTS